MNTDAMKGIGLPHSPFQQVRTDGFHNFVGARSALHHVDFQTSQELMPATSTPSGRIPSITPDREHWLEPPPNNSSAHYWLNHSVGHLLLATDESSLDRNAGILQTSGAQKDGQNQCDLDIRP